MTTSSTRRTGALALLALLALVFSFATPALAGAPEPGDRPSVSGSSDDDSAADTDPADADVDNRHPSGKDRHEDKGTQGRSTSTPDQNGDGPERDFGGTDKPFVSGDGSGGMDVQDQDGNNGCGNDDDFEDDNEGWCGKPASSTTPPEVDDDDVTKPECPERNEMGDTHANGPKGCDDDDTEVGGETETTCPKDGETLPAGTAMPDGCTTTSPSGTVTAATVSTSAVLGNQLENASAAAAADDEASVLGVQLERTAPAGGAPAAAGTSVLGAALARTGTSLTVLLVALALGLLAVGVLLKRTARA